MGGANVLMQHMCSQTRVRACVCVYANAIIRAIIRDILVLHKY